MDSIPEEIMAVIAGHAKDCRNLLRFCGSSTRARSACSEHVAQVSELMAAKRPLFMNRVLRDDPLFKGVSTYNDLMKVCKLANTRNLLNEALEGLEWIRRKMRRYDVVVFDFERENGDAIVFRFTERQVRVSLYDHTGSPILSANRDNMAEFVERATALRATLGAIDYFTTDVSESLVEIRNGSVPVYREGREAHVYPDQESSA